MMSSFPDKAERLDSFVMPPYPVRRFSVTEYHTLAEIGALEEDDRIELLEGWMVPKAKHNPPHDWTVTHVARRIRESLTDDWLLRIRCPITTEDSEPEPDHAVVRGPNDRYLQRHPRSEDIGLVVEVAESSLSKDRRKTAIYAADGIPLYWIINLACRHIEVFSDPEPANRAYQSQRIVKPGKMLEVILDGKAVGNFNVTDLLPPSAATDN